ncbi:MAG TPA: hypothetical protein PK771_14920, partial [Spirochaetota bacterium]|nr:hypothetical protein [Spirochaetota bacterium]
MKIEFTKEQFEKLILLSLTGNIVINSYRDDEEALTEYDDLTEYILSCAKEFGLSKMVNYDKENKEYLPSNEAQNEIIEMLEEYDATVFTDDLINALTYRDMIEKYGEDKIDNMSEAEFAEKKAPFSKKYTDEIMEN